MKIAVIGGGFTGLSAAYQLSKLGHNVTIFEKDEKPGGLAVGFKMPIWSWSLEKHYHHWFTNDSAAINLANELNFEVITRRPKTSVYIDNHIYQLDSALNLIKFPPLSLFHKLRMSIALASLRSNPFWQPLEKIKAVDFLPKLMGDEAYKKIWEPLLISKFGKYHTDISLAWFWARIRKRTSSLAYPKGGFLEFANALVKKIEERGGKLLFNTEVTELKINDKVSLKYSYTSSEVPLSGMSREVSNETMKQLNNFDKVVVTLPSFLFLKIAPQLPLDYKNKLMGLKGLGAINLILRLKESFLKDGTYWLNICDKKSPIMAIVEHTNFMDKKYYNNEHIVYLGNYFPHEHPYMKINPTELLKIYDPYLRKINKTYRLSLIACHLFTVPFAQPIIPVNYSKIIPPFETPLKNVYLANIQQVYPWDRGTNYAIELGEKIAKLVMSKNS